LEQVAEALPTPVSEASAASTASAQLLDGIDRPEARVYQMDSDDLSVVMVIDESFGESLDV
jgi:hypothetical protein